MTPLQEDSIELAARKFGVFLFTQIDPDRRAIVLLMLCADVLRSLPEVQRIEFINEFRTSMSVIRGCDEAHAAPWLWNGCTP